jgi:hypothetical protein
MNRNPPAPTGFTAGGDPIVRKEMPNAGRGYKPNNKDRNNPRYVGVLNYSEVRFRRQDIKKPYTAFPD